jgi:hypothetical protein
MDFSQKYLKYQNKLQLGGLNRFRLVSNLPKILKPLQVVPLYPTVPLKPTSIPRPSIVRNYSSVGEGGVTYLPSLKINKHIIPSPPTKPASYPSTKNFLLYGTFEDSFTPLIQSVMENITINSDHKHLTFKKTIKEPHTSVVYEPEWLLKNDEDFDKYSVEINKITNIDQLYSKCIDQIGSIDDLILEGASAFYRENIVIIKIGFNSQKMNAIRNCLYSSDEMKVYEERWRTKVTNPIIKEKFGSSKYYQDDKTFDKSNPQLWVHATIAALKADTPIEDIDKYIEQVQKQLVDLNVIGKRFSINEFKLRDPEMNITTIWKK